MTSVTDILGPPPAAAPPGAAPGKQSVTDILGPPPAAAAQPEPEQDTSGLTFNDMAALSSADTPEEAKAYLEGVYGKSKVHVEKDGQLSVDRDGKRVLAKGGPWYEKLLAAGVAHGPEIIGAAGGAMLGAAGGPAGALAGAGAGMALGKGAEEANKAARGYRRGSALNETARIASAGAAGVEGEAGGTLAAKAIGKVAGGGLPKLITGTTDEIKATYRRLTAGDPKARVPYQSLAPDLKKFARVEMMADKISGAATGRNEANRSVLEQRTKEVLKQGGVPANRADAAYRDMKAGEFADVGQDAGAAVQRSIQAHVDMLQGRIDGIMSDATRDLDQQLTHLDGLVKDHPAGALGVDVAKGITAARRSFASASERMYTSVGQAFGDRPTFSTNRILGAAGRIAKVSQGGIGGPAAAREVLAKLDAAIPEHVEESSIVDSSGKAFSSLVPEQGGMMTFEQVQRFRTRMRELADSGNLTPGVTKHEIRLLEQAADETIQEAAAFDEGNASAVALLNRADELYEQGIAKFKDSDINQIVQRYKATKSTPDPEQIAGLLVRAGESGRIPELKATMPPEVWARVQSQDLENIINDARETGSGEVTGLKLAQTLDGRGERVLDAVHGPQVRKRLTQFAQDLMAVDGKLPTENLTDQGFRQLMDEFEGANAELDRFLKEDPAAVLRDPKLNPRFVFSRVVRPGNNAILKRVADIIGKKSPEMQQLQEAALQRVLARSVYQYTKGSEAPAATRVADALRLYTKEERSILFPDNMDNAIEGLAQDMMFLFPRPKDPAVAGMSAGGKLEQPAIKFGLPKTFGGKGLITGRWYLQAMNGAGRWLIEHPGFQRYIIGETLPNSVRGKISSGAQVAAKNLMRLIAAQSIQQQQDGDAQSNSQPGP